MSDKIVMLVEDIGFLRGLLKNFLRSEGYYVITASDAEETLTLISEIKPDVVVLDTVLSRPNIRELRHKINLVQDIPVIEINTANREIEMLENDLPQIAQFFRETFSLDDLLYRIRLECKDAD